MKEGWEVKKLGEVCEVVNGGTPKTSVARYWGGDHLWITPAEMGKRKSPYVSDTKRKLSDAGLENCSASLVPSYSVILSSRAPIGHLVINTDMMGSNQGCKALVPTEQIEYKFLYYYLKSIVQLLQSLGTGATFKELSGKTLKSVSIPIPPLPEQERIVAILDEAFAGIDAAIKHTEQNLANARAVFESHLDAVFSQKGDGWEEKRLGDVCEFENGDRGKNYPNRKEYVNVGIPWINTGHIERDGTLSVSSMNYITKEKFNSLRSGKIQPGDLVYCLRGATLGKTAFVAPFQQGAVASSLVILRPKKTLDSKFLYSYLTSPFGQKQIKRFANGAAQPNLGAKSVAKFQIALPGISMQESIAEQLIVFHDETQSLESIYTRKIAALKELKSSLLDQAFRGELT